MDSFLQQQRERGAFDSSGGFSVNPFKAREKMAAFQTLVRGFYMLRLVQAGVLAASTGIHVHIGWRELKVTLEGADLELFPPDTVQTGFGQSFTQGSGQARDFLMNGLNHLLSGELERLTVTWFKPDGTFTELLACEERLALSSGTGSHSRSSLQIKVERSANPAAVADETQALHSRCASCPVPIWVDGKLVNSPTNPFSSLYRGDYPFSAKVHGYLPRNYVLGERRLAYKGGTGLALTRVENLKFQLLDKVGVQTRGDTKQDTLLVQLSDGARDGLIRIPLAPSSRGTIKYLQAGVTVETESHRFGGVEIFLCVDHMSTDVSGLKLIRDENYTEALTFLLAELNLLIRGLYTCYDSLVARFDWTDERKVGAVTGVIVGGIYMWSAAALLAVPVFGKLWAMGMLASTGVAGRLGVSARDRLNRDLRDAVDDRLLDLSKTDGF